MILLIETSAEICSVALGQGKQCVACVESNIKNSHAEKIIPLIEQVLQKAQITLSQVEAVCISQGPGSYTGLRIGTSTAKGLSYSLNLPLIAVDALQGLAWTAIKEHPDADLFIPMLDAGRMEVYASFVDKEQKILQPTTNLIVNERTFADLLKQHTIVFCGNAIEKVKPLYLTNPNAYFSELSISAKNLLSIAYEKFLCRDFVDIAYFEPFYLKEYHAGMPKVKGL